jgi:flagellar biosynthesis protein
MSRPGLPPRRTPLPSSLEPERNASRSRTPAPSGQDGEHPKPRRAVALRYDPDGSTAPVVSAAGQGLVADEIIRRAREAGVPITEDPQLAAVLSQIDVGAVIPPELYAVIAEVLTYVYGLDKRVGRRRV